MNFVDNPKSEIYENYFSTNIDESAVSVLLCYLTERIPELFHFGVLEFVFGDVHLQQINKGYQGLLFGHIYMIYYLVINIPRTQIYDIFCT